MSRLYIVIRNDIDSMNPGKAMAQASHAASQFVTMFPKESKEWANEAQGFGTTIVMEGSLTDIARWYDNDTIIDLPHGKIVDPTYPFKAQVELLDLVAVPKKLNLVIDSMSVPDKYGMISATREETTCFWVFVKDEEDVEKIKQLFEVNDIHLCR